MKSRITRPNEAAATRLPVIGKLKCGLKPEGKNFPTSVDYFIPSGKYAPTFERIFGKKPSSIPIVFLEDTAENQCEERYEYRDGAGDLYAYGDGTIFAVWNGKKYETFFRDQHPDIMERVHSKVSGKGWTVTLTVRFLIPSLPIVGLWQLTTKGAASSIPSIVSMFDKVVEHRGSVKGMIFDLNVSFAKSQKPGDKSRYPVIEIVPTNEPERVEGIRNDILNNSKLLGNG